MYRQSFLDAEMPNRNRVTVPNGSRLLATDERNKNDSHALDCWCKEGQERYE
jgi:hypothetical protein